MESIVNTIQKNIKTITLFGFFVVFMYLLFMLIGSFVPGFGDTELYRLFDIGHEMNVPTFFSAFLFLNLAAISLFLGLKEKGAEVSFKKWLPWVIMGGIFIFLSADEMFEIHERFTYLTQQVINVSGFLSFAWVIPYGILAILLGLLFLPFLKSLPKDSRTLMFKAAAVYLIGVIGFEMIGAKGYEIGGPTNNIFIFASSVEEILEISGLIIALWAFSMEAKKKLS